MATNLVTLRLSAADMISPASDARLRSTPLYTGAKYAEGLRCAQEEIGRYGKEKFIQDGVESKYSCGISVILQQATEPLTAAYSGAWLVLTHLVPREQQNVVFSLVIPLAVKMVDELG